MNNASGNEPTLVSDAQNGKDAADFSGASNEFLRTGTFPATQHGGAAFAGMYDTALFTGFDAAVTAEFGKHSSFGGNNGTVNFEFNSGGTDHKKNGIDTKVGPMGGAWSVCVYHDTSPDDHTATKWVIGADREQSGRQWTGQIGEVLVFDEGPAAAGLTVAERTAIARYLGARWDISVTLPSA